MAERNDRVSFKGAHGMELAARLDPPEGPPIAYALFAHCFTCSKDIFAASRISEALTEQGIAVLRFDFTGSAKQVKGNINLTRNATEAAVASSLQAILDPDVPNNQGMLDLPEIIARV